MLDHGRPVNPEELASASCVELAVARSGVPARGRRLEASDGGPGSGVDVTPSGRTTAGSDPALGVHGCG
eukprot:5156109-Alexandrium_andersonii.AAC.1